jgi:hypothetical protein
VSLLRGAGRFVVIILGTTVPASLLRVVGTVVLFTACPTVAGIAASLSLAASLASLALGRLVGLVALLGEVDKVILQEEASGESVID